MQVILIRHGACKENLERRFVGVTDSPLASEGEAQVIKLSRMMPETDHLYVSPLLRCRQTAAILWPDTPQTTITELRETNFGPFEGKTHEELVNDELYKRWISNPDAPGIVPQVEDIVQCQRRATKALEILLEDGRKHQYETVGVVTHGGTIMSMLASHGSRKTDYYRMQVENCGGFIVKPTGAGKEIYLSILKSF